MPKSKVITKPTNNDQTLTQMGYVEVGALQMHQTALESSGSEEDSVFEVITPPSKKRPKIENEKVEVKPKRTDNSETFGSLSGSDPRFHLRVPCASIEDVENQDHLHPVYGYTKHWFEKDYIDLKQEQVVHRLNWWRKKNEEIMEYNDEMYGQEKLDAFYHSVVNEIIKVEELVKNYRYVVLNALNREALALVLRKDKNDGIVYLVYNLIRSKKMSIFKAEWNASFKSITIFQKYNEIEPYGEVSVEAGETFEWKKYQQSEN